MKFVAISIITLFAAMVMPGDGTFIPGSPAQAINLDALPNHALARPVSAIERALVISIDGLRPDVLLRANAPNLHHLYQTGSFSFWARTTVVSITLPSHVSMLTGATPENHGIRFNTDQIPSRTIYPAVPTLFELAHRVGYTTAMAAGKSKFSALNRPRSLDWVYLPILPVVPDSIVADHACDMIREHAPQVMFIHLPGVDVAGHTRGWGSIAQMQAVGTADQAVGRVLAVLSERHLLDSTFILISADHGGQGGGHGPGDPRSRHIPWIANGPSIRHDFDLTLYPRLTINTQDTFATVCWLMGIPTPSWRLQSKPIRQMIVQEELLHSIH